MQSNWDDIYAEGEAFFGSDPDHLARDYVCDAGGLRVLDVGAGQGRNCIPLARNGHAVTAIDSSEVGIAQVRAMA